MTLVPPIPPRPARAAGRSASPPGASSAAEVLRPVLACLDAALWRATLQPTRVVEWIAAPGLAIDGEPAAADGAQVDWESRIYPPDLPRFREALDAFRREPTTRRSIDYRLIVADGELLWLRHWFLAAEAGADPAHPLVTGVVRVVQQEKHLEVEAMRAGENERSRIGQEIHDDVCQVLAGLNYLVHLLHQRLQKERPAEAAEVEAINLEIQAGLERTRALAHGLLPGKSNFNTLSQALRDLSRQVGTRFGLQLNVTLPPEAPRFSRERLLHLFRIVQEAASNSFKHGRASEVEVSLASHDGWHVLTIEDNGAGPPPASARVEGVGLNVMRSRAEILGGRLEFGPGARGARVQVFLPEHAAT